MLPQALSVIDAWGFTYKTVGFFWVKRTKHGKSHIGTGYWTRANPEQCLLATRGRPKRVSASVRALVEAPLREHSRKPDEVRERIQALVPGPYCELFARSSAPGWDVAFSDESGLFDGACAPVATRRIPSTRMAL
jgi:N6-adenosine-specific RNA methylase IME4